MKANRFSPIAAVDELTAAEAIERISVEFEPLPFVVDPVESLRPNGPNARSEGNVWVRPMAPAASTAGRGNQAPAPTPAPANPQVQELKWTADDFAAATDGQLPLGKATDEWTVGDRRRRLQSRRPRPRRDVRRCRTRAISRSKRVSAMAYWQNGKLYMHCSTQSTMRTISAVARWVGTDAANVVIISEYTGRRFRQQGLLVGVHGRPGAAVEEARRRPGHDADHARRRAVHRAGASGPARAAQGRIPARTAGSRRSTAWRSSTTVRTTSSATAARPATTSRCRYQPPAMRWRSVSVLTNTPPRGAQRAPGGMQGNGVMEPILAKAARQLGIDQVAIHRINAPEGKATFGAVGRDGKRPHARPARS